MKWVGGGWEGWQQGHNNIGLVHEFHCNFVLLQSSRFWAKALHLFPFQLLLCPVSPDNIEKLHRYPRLWTVDFSTCVPCLLFEKYSIFSSITCTVYTEYSELMLGWRLCANFGTQTGFTELLRSNAKGGNVAAVHGDISFFHFYFSAVCRGGCRLYAEVSYARENMVRCVLSPIVARSTVVLLVTILDCTLLLSTWLCSLAWKMAWTCINDSL